MTDNFIKKPCQHCPFKHSVPPFLTPERGAELAYAAENPYNDFWCHKTTESVEDEYGNDCIAVEDSKLCAGFLTLRATVTDRGLPEGFEPSYREVYDDPFTMVQAYAEEWDR